jgi:hypothetical protein
MARHISRRKHLAQRESEKSEFRDLMRHHPIHSSLAEAASGLAVP